MTTFFVACGKKQQGVNTMFSFFGKAKEPPKHEVLQQLKALDVYQNHAYEDETEKAITQFQQNLYNTIDAIIETPDNSFTIQADRMQAEASALQEKLKEAIEQWEHHKQSMKETVEKGVAFVQSTNFYPPEYVFHLNKIEGFTIEMSELQEKNPLASANEFFEFRDQVERDIALFSELHQETIDLMQKIEQRMAQKQKAETQNMLEIKESLFRALQMGHLLQAKSDVKKLKKEVKRF